MGLPPPPKPLEAHCSAIFNETLYIFSATQFYSIPLSKNAKWSELEMAVGTEGASCVHAHRETPEESLYVLGGVSSDPTKTPETGFQAIQRYRFNENRWENIQLADPITFNLINHGAVFLEATNQILLFSGTRFPDTTTPSSMTFLIDTAPPYTITSKEGDRAFPLLAPNVMNWGPSGALVAGGDVNNRNMYTYDLNNGWNTLGVQLEKGLPPRGQASTALVEGSEGAKLMLTIDMSVVPSEYRQVKVQDSRFERRSSSSSKLSKRAHYIPVLSTPVSSWPEYDGSLAPKSKRDGFSLAQSQKYIVVSGGDDEDPLCIFDVQNNKWMNATALMASSSDRTALQELEESESPTPTPSATGSLLPTSPDANPAATSDGTSKLSTLQILFIILGAVLFLAILLFACLIFLRKKTRARKGRGEDPDGRMSFQDRGISSYMKETGGGTSASKSPRSRGFGAPQQNTYSQNSLDKELGLPAASMTPHNGGKNERSSGWSKYFSGNSTNLINLPSRTYSHSSYNDNTTSTRFPYASGVPSECGVAPLTLAPKDQRDPYTQHPGSQPRQSAVSLASSYGGNSVYSEGSIAEKPLWDGKKGQVMESPRGWGVVVNDERASSIYPESAVIDGREVGGDGRGNGGYRGDGRDDLSWLNLRQ